VTVLYRYLALSESGKKVTGVIDAESLAAAKEKLRAAKILATDLAHFEEKKKELKLSFPVLLDFTRMMGQLLKAGIPLYESLVILEEKYQRLRFHPLLIDLCDSLKSGRSLSDTLKHYPHTFDPVYVAMVHAGEQTASLPTVFEELCALLQRQQKLKRQLIAAAAYPMFLGLFCIVVFFALLLFVIPSMKNLFDGKALHPITKFVFGASDFVLHHGITLALVSALVIFGLTVLLRHKRLRPWWDSLILKIPFLRQLVQESATIRLCRTASLLLFGGLPILSVLHLSSRVLKNYHLEAVMADAAKQVSEGKPLSVPLRASPLIPSLVPRMLAIAEETGKTAFMLQSIATICEENLEKRLQQLTTFLQPALLLLLGLIVGLVLLSILIPLTDVGSILE
jgi:general secretion pathway protein F